MTKNNYQIEKIIESLFNKGHTNFIIEEDLIKIKKLGEKIRKENIKIPDIPDFLQNKEKKK